VNAAHRIKVTHTVVHHTTFIISLKWYNFEYTFHAEHILRVSILIICLATLLSENYRSMKTGKITIDRKHTAMLQDREGS